MSSIHKKPLEEKNGDRRPIILMLAIGFFIGCYLAIYQVVADSLFLNRLPDQLNTAFLVAGFLGIITTALFNIGQNEIRFSWLVTISLFLVVLFTSSVYVAYHFGPDEYKDPIIFIMYCLTGPTTALLLLCYWGTFGRLFDFKQSKKIVGRIDSGQIVAAIIAFFLFPVLSPYVVDTSNFLIVCVISIFGAAGLLILVSTNFKDDRNMPNRDKEIRKETSIIKLLRDPYGLLLSAFVVLSMASFIFTQYSFQELTKVQFQSQKEIADFLAYFNGTVYAISFLMQTFINDRLMGNYGIKISLLVLPSVLIIFAIFASLTGITLGTSPESAPSTFIFFFIFIALTRWFNWMIRDSLEAPVFKLLFMPLEARVRFSIQSKIEGIINESGRLLAGLIIFCLALIPFFDVLWIAILLVLLLVLYFAIVIKLYGQYRTKIKSRLETKDPNQEKLEFGMTQLIKKLESLMSLGNVSRSVFSFKLLEKIDPTRISDWVNALIKNNEDETKVFAQKKMNELKGLSVSERYVIRETELLKERTVLSKTDLDALLSGGGEITRGRIQKLSRSSHAEDRIYSAELILNSFGDENIPFLTELLNDNDPKVRYTSIQTAAKKNNPEVIFSLIENLGNTVSGNQCMHVLELIGQKAVPYLDTSFYRSGQQVNILIKIIQLLGRIGGQKAKDYLWNKIDYPDKIIVSHVLMALGECGFKANLTQSTRIRFAIENDIGDISWNLGAIKEIGDEDEINDLLEALKWEIEKDIEHLYMLLAMIYDTRSIQLVKENIESDTAEGTAYAIELLDIFLSEQLKQRVIPVLDDISETEKVTKLETFYPRVRLNVNLVLKFLLNRDFTQSNRWTKACVLKRIGHQKIDDFRMDLIAQIFNPDQLISEVAAWSLYQIGSEVYHENTRRLGADLKMKLDRVVIPSGESRMMRFDIIKFYQTIDVLSSIPCITVSYLADISEEIKLYENETVKIDETINDYFYIVYSGNVEYFEKGRLVKKLIPGEFVGEMFSGLGFINSIIIRSAGESRILKIDKTACYELLSGNVTLADKFLEYI